MTQTTATKYRKKPVVIEAAQFNGSYESACAIRDWAGPYQGSISFTGDGTLSILTREGVMTASTEDWIIRGVKDEFYPCKPDIFAATYESA